jgi:hypothetical protein
MKNLKFALGLSFVLFACGKEKTEEPMPSAAPTAPAPAPEPPTMKAPEPAPTAAAPAPGEAATQGARKQENCPTAVPGAETKVNETKTGVEVLVTSKDPAATTAIREDAAHLAKVSTKGGEEVKHTGEGTGGGGLGKCPIVLKDTKVTATDIEGGSKIVVTPAKKDQLDWLKTEIKSRLAAAPAAPMPSK